MPSEVAIVGAGFTEACSPSRETRSEVEICFSAVQRALEHAGLSIQDVDAVVFGTIDGFEATNLIARFLGSAFGQAHGIPVLQVSTGGSTGGNVVNAARNFAVSGDYDVVLCVGAPTFVGPPDIQAVLNTASAYVIEQPLGIGAVHMGSIYGAAYQERYGVGDEDFAAIAVRAYANAQHNPYAHLSGELTVDDVLESRMVATPLRFRSTCPVSSGGSAVVVTSEDGAARCQTTPVWIRSAGSVADTYLAGGRSDFSRFESLAVLARKVLRDGRVGDPRKDLDVLELFVPYAPFEFLEYEAIGLCDEGEAPTLFHSGETSFQGSLPVNLSGGPLCTNPGVAAQLAPYGYVALQLMGQAAGGRQVEGARRGIAHSTGGNFFQFHTMAVLETD